MPHTLQKYQIFNAKIRNQLLTYDPITLLIFPFSVVVYVAAFTATPVKTNTNFQKFCIYILHVCHVSKAQLKLLFCLKQADLSLIDSM